jgi:hypothetical protein
VTAYGRYAAAVQRLADLTGILRTRAGDVDRTERNGAPPEAQAQITAAVERLERVVRDLEKAAA